MSYMNLSFQSRNRDAFLFKHRGERFSRDRNQWFQSRNRDAFLFKSNKIAGGMGTKTKGFNLVIEMLFFSSERRDRTDAWADRWFQSRNRDAFLFKSSRRLKSARSQWSFNLVIEMLFFSSILRCRRRQPHV